jgi:hypothetical protein
MKEMRICLIDMANKLYIRNYFTKERFLNMVSLENTNRIYIPCNYKTELALRKLGYINLGILT